jgi:hypothetical protein
LAIKKAEHNPIEAMRAAAPQAAFFAVTTAFFLYLLYFRSERMRLFLRYILLAPVIFVVIGYSHCFNRIYTAAAGDEK